MTTTPAKLTRNRVGDPEGKLACKKHNYSSDSLKRFRAQIWAFYGQSGRKLPWRNTRDPYKIMVSEVMLQQTQVSRVLGKYREFLEEFPTIQSLASAPLSRVLRLWQGMGYNRRAKHLHDTSKIVVSEYQGKIPRTEEELLQLQGIGRYTANAILTFAYNEPRVFIETNIRRVYIHIFFQRRKEVSDKEILQIIENTLDTKKPRDWYYALMDYGAQLPKDVHRNANVQSKHYTKQSAFKGSLREVRGIIIRKLSNAPSTFSELRHACGDGERAKDAISGLLKDNLISYEKTKYKLA